MRVVKPYSLFDRLRTVPDDLGLTGEQKGRWQTVLAGALTDITLNRGRIVQDQARSAERSPSLPTALESDATRHAVRLGMTRERIIEEPHPLLHVADARTAPACRPASRLPLLGPVRITALVGSPALTALSL
jgi:hypothetical protein